MRKRAKLPVVTKKKKINVEEFVRLAKKVRKYLEEEQEYLNKNEDRQTSRILYHD